MSVMMRPASGAGAVTANCMLRRTDTLLRRWIIRFGNTLNLQMEKRQRERVEKKRG